MPSKLGIHCIYPDMTLPLVRQAAERGAYWPMVKAVNNAGVAIDVKAVDPRTLTITRFVNDQWDSVQDIEIWPTSRYAQAAQETVQLIFDRTNEDERAAADWLEVLNEADPPGVVGWHNFGVFLIEVIKEANRRGVKVALPAFNYGTPEWDEIVALVETGVFAWMKAGGHLLTIHEGVDPGSDDPFVFGPIPGAPNIPNAGPTVYRYRYLYHLLAQRDEVVPCVISEFYSGGGYNWEKRDLILSRMIQYDREIRKDAYVLAVLPFTVDPGPNWQHQNYNPFYPDVLNYVVSETNVVDQILIADSSKFQCRFLGDPNSFSDQYNPLKWVVDWDWDAIKASPVLGFIVRVGISLNKDPVFDRIVEGLQSIGKLLGIYHAYNPSIPSQAQADMVRLWWPHPTLAGTFADIEMGNPLFGATNDYLLALDRHYNRLTGIYSAAWFLDSHYTANEQKQWRGRPAWFAGYPGLIVPAGWTNYLPTHHLHQFTASYAVPGIPRLIDMNRLNPTISLSDFLAPVPLEESNMAIFFTLRNLPPELADQVEAHIQALYADVEQNGRVQPYGQGPVPVPQPLYRAEVLYNVTLRDGNGNVIQYTNGLTYVPKGAIVDVWEEFDLPNFPNRALISLDPLRPNIVMVTQASGPALRRL